MGFFPNGMLHMHPLVLELTTAPYTLLLQGKETDV